MALLIAMGHRVGWFLNNLVGCLWSIFVAGGVLYRFAWQYRKYFSHRKLLRKLPPDAMGIPKLWVGVKDKPFAMILFSEGNARFKLTLGDYFKAGA